MQSDTVSLETYLIQFSAITDQLAYGRPSAMHFYLTMYRNFPDIIARAVPDSASFGDSWLCLDVPNGPEHTDCSQTEFCTIECNLSWYLHSWGIEMTVDWRWPFTIRRS